MSAQNFDMENYIQQRLTEITDTDERSFAKEVLLKGLLPAFRTMDERYRELEERVKREIEIKNQRFVVMTTVVRRQDYDPTNRTWFPVCPDDRSVYFQGTEQEKRTFEETEYFTATDEQGNMHRVGVRRATRYREAVEELYHIFVYNRVPWNTINTGQIDRFYELYPLDGEETMEDWVISYGDWTEWINTEYMAVWNIEKFLFHCTKFMVPSLDGKYFEHELDLKDYNKDSSYMVGGNEEIMSIRYEEDKIILTSLKETFEDWTAYRFSNQVDVDSYGYKNRILSNRRDTGFTDCLTERQGHGIHSKTEIFRIVEGLEVGEYIRLTDCRIRDREQKGSFSADMNRFIREEVFPMETRRILELIFNKVEDAGQEEPYCVEDMLRYAISQVQLLLDEYKCVGVLA